MACSNDQTDAGDEYGGTDGGGGGTACEPAPGEFEPELDWSQAENPGLSRNVVAAHVAHLPPRGPERDVDTARIFMMGGDVDQHIWDPLTGDFVAVTLPQPDSGINFFCAGHVVTPNGSFVMTGGGGFDPVLAINEVYRLDRVADTGNWFQLAPMNHTRWYPTLTTLSDGKALAYGGAGTGPRTPEIFDPSVGFTGAWTELPQGPQSPSYPFMFVLPDGNVFYAGGESYTAEDPSVGRVLVLNDGPAYWSGRTYTASIPGGSAVQYWPGKFMKSGGGNSATSRTQWVDMNGDYLGANRTWENRPGVEGDMLEPRHFHHLTILPDGRVLATGGNWYGNGDGGDSPSNPCDDPPGSGNMINQMLCAQGSDCPTFLCSENAADHDSDRATDREKTCNPRNNACYATQTAEIWDPDTGLWSPCNEAVAAEEDNPRMYHSSALLLRDGGVIAMGGGVRSGLENQYNAQIYRPDYGSGPAPVLTLTTDSITYGQSFNVGVSGGLPAKFNLIRLGSATHSFDMGQRLVPILDFDAEDGSDSYTLEAPSLPGAAPPGWYMLFAVTALGAISEGQYLEINSLPPVEWLCQPGNGLSIKEKGCLPSPGPTCGGSTSDITLLAPSLGGSSRGWAVQTPATAILDASSPNAEERDHVLDLCEAACQREWQNEPGVVATCSSPTAFITPTTRAPTGPRVQSSLIDAYAHGEGLFPGAPLACELDDDCCTAFDESVCAAARDRPTPAASPIGRGEAFRVPWSTATSKLEFITSNGTWTRALTGTGGFSPCRDGNATAACPFYLGSLTASTTSAMSPTAQCSDGSTATLSVSGVSIALAQPATGVARQGTTARAFPAGGLVLAVSATVAGQVHNRRLPTTNKVVGTQNGAALSFANLDTPLVLPCGGGTTTVTARVTLASTAATGAPPTATITVPAAVTCGTSRALTATTSDPNGDIVSTRWLVDGRLLAASVSSVTFTGTRELSVRVRDARGATTTAKKVISCL